MVLLTLLQPLAMTLSWATTMVLKSMRPTGVTSGLGSSDFGALNKTTSQTAGWGLKTKTRQQDQSADQHEETSEH